MFLLSVLSFSVKMTVPRPARQILRWGAHALRNLAVTSPLMQAHCGDAGAIDVLCVHAASHRGALMAQLQACKAVAYLAKGHPENQARAASAGCMEMALRMLALVEETERRVPVLVALDVKVISTPPCILY